MSSGVLVVLMGLGFFIHSKTSKGVKLTDHIQANSIRTFRQQFSFKSCSPTKPLLAALLLLMLFIHIGCIFPLGRVYSKIIFSYDRDGPGFSVAKSSLMTSVFFISSLCGILIFTIPATFIHVKYLLQVRQSTILPNFDHKGAHSYWSHWPKPFCIVSALHSLRAVFLTHNLVKCIEWKNWKIGNLINDLHFVLDFFLQWQSKL